MPAPEPISRLSLGPVTDETGRQLALEEIERKINEVVEAVNQLITLVA